MHREKTNKTTLTKKGPKVNFIEHLGSQVIAGKWTQTCRVTIWTTEMTMKVLNLMWKKTGTDYISQSMVKWGTVGQLVSKDLVCDQKSNRQQPAYGE